MQWKLDTDLFNFKNDDSQFPLISRMIIFGGNFEEDGYFSDHSKRFDPYKDQLLLLPPFNEPKIPHSTDIPNYIYHHAYFFNKNESFIVTHCHSDYNYTDKGH